jgi:hypothetical protein
MSASTKDAMFQRIAEVTHPSPTKETNPKDAVGTAKVPLLSVVPLRVLGGIALAMLEGARKYGRHNYRVSGVRASVYLDALGRHMAAWWEGQDIDPDSGLNHIDKAIASLVVLRDSMYQGNWTDDRPPSAAETWLGDANQKAKDLIDKHPDAKPACTQVKP